MGVKRHLSWNWAVLFTSVDKRYYDDNLLLIRMYICLDTRLKSVWLLPWMGLMMLAHSQCQLSLSVYVVVFGFYQDFFDRGLLLTRKFLNPRVPIGYVEVINTWLTVTEYQCHKWARYFLSVVIWYITELSTGTARWMPLVEQELITHRKLALFYLYTVYLSNTFINTIWYNRLWRISTFI